MPPRGKTRLTPDSGWRSSNLSPYDEDLRTPIHIRHQHRLKRQKLDVEMDPSQLFTEDGGSGQSTDGLDGSSDKVLLETSTSTADPPEEIHLSQDRSDQIQSSPLPSDGLVHPAPRPSFSNLRQPPGLEQTKTEPSPDEDEDEDDFAIISYEGSPAPTDILSTTASLSESPRPSSFKPLTLTQARRLLPRRDAQVDLYKICALLRKVVLACPKDFEVVEPHDFMGVLSWRHVEELPRKGLSIFQRLRRSQPTRLLVPFL